MPTTQTVEKTKSETDIRHALIVHSITYLIEDALRKAQGPVELVMQKSNNGIVNYLLNSSNGTLNLEEQYVQEIGKLTSQQNQLSPGESKRLVFDGKLGMHDILFRIKNWDNAQSTVKAPGGIDFNSDKMNLETKSEGGEIKFHVDPAMLEQLRNAPGFTPVIINIQPMNDIRLFLGLLDTKPQTQLSKV